VITALLFAAAVLAAQSAVAQELQRCEGPDGKVSYAQGPCPDGTRAVRSLPPVEPPSSADKKAAQQRAQQDVRNAAALDRARKAEEERQAREQAQAQAKLAKQEAHCGRLQSRLDAARKELAEAPAKNRAEVQRRVKRAEQLFVEDCGPLKP